MDLGFRLTMGSGSTGVACVSILGLMDLGFRPVDNIISIIDLLCFNPWFNGFRF